MKPFRLTRKEILKDPREAAEYLNTVFEEGDPAMFMVALRNVAEAHGGLLDISKKTKLNRGNLYRIFSEKGNPGIQNLETLLEALGLKLQVGILKEPRMKRAA